MHCFAADAVEWFEIDAGVGRKHVAVDVVQRQNTSHEDVVVLQQGFFCHTVNQAHIEPSLVFLFDDKLVNVLVKVVTHLLTAIGVQQREPFHKFFRRLIRRIEGCLIPTSYRSSC